MNVERVWQKVYVPTGEILAEVKVNKGKKVSEFELVRITDMVETSDTPDFACYYYEDGVMR